MIQEALKRAALAPLDAEVLLAAILGKDRTWLFAHGEEELTEEPQTQFTEWVKRRQTGEPVAYITGEKLFYGRAFNVNPCVLIPRPSTEGLVDLTLEFLNTGEDTMRQADSGIVVVSRALGDISDVQTIVDVGAGSGCVAITLALERPELKLIATDIREDILDVARENAAKHGVTDRIDFRLGKSLEPVADLEEPFVVVSNPPYIPEGEELMLDVVEFEPAEALFAGPEGMDIIRPLIADAKKHSMCRGIVIECRKEQV